VRSDLPSGTVTFLFTDVEGSTKLLHELGADRYADALAEHRRVLRDAFVAHGGVEVDTQGDAFFIAFPTAPSALQAAVAANDGLAPGPIRMRMGIHTGTPHVGEEGYVGVDVHRAARIAACGHGGQVLVSASTALLVGTEELRDLGEHRLKDLSAPERVYQLGEEDFPPLTSLHRTNLPITSTPFLGREQELSEVLGLLSREDVRLLTLTGTGGTGKTRLGLQAAAELAERYPHGVWWVPLGPIRDSKLVVETAAQALGAENGLADHIGDRSLLLLFDNFEHLVEAATDLAGLLASCPSLDLLVTSREPLHVTGEQEYAVPPLAHDESTSFFVARARAVQPDFEAGDTVQEICRRLDDLPLALELAAARVKALSPEQILERLEQALPLLTGGARDLPERQRTLRATIEWSYDLLAPDEQRLFARLAVFAGGCTLDAAEDVVEAAVDTLQSLVDKSLVRHTGDRFWMLETIREYAAERLEVSGEAEELRRRHAEYFLAFAEVAEPRIRVYSSEWLDRVERENDNVRTALRQFEDSGEGEQALRLGGAVWWYWCYRNRHGEGRLHLEAALASDRRVTAARAKALVGGADMALNVGDSETARHRAEEALALNRKLDLPQGIADATLMVATCAANESESELARDLLEESARRFRELGDEHNVLIANRLLGSMLAELGDRDGARVLHAQNLVRARSLGDRAVEATTLASLASLADREGRAVDALPLLKESLAISRELGALLPMRMGLCRFAHAVVLTGRPELGARLLASSEALSQEIPGNFSWLAQLNEETLAAIRDQLDEAAFAEAWEEGRVLTLDEAVTMALEQG
jgi:predicted ATPase/class 3 adenylate cyclase